MCTDLVKEQLPPLLLAQVHLLDRHLAVVGAIAGDADDARRALANLDEVLQEGARVARTDHEL